MTIFEYVMVLLSMVLSLSLTQLVSGVGELARSRNVRWSLAHGLWIVVGFGLILDVWTSYWLIRDVPRWGLLSIVFMLLQTIAIYLFNLWLLPRLAGDEPMDLNAFLLDNRRLFLGAVIASYIAGVIFNVSLVPPETFELSNYAILPIAVGISAAAWWFRAGWVQIAAPALTLAMMLFYFATHFQTIG
ncbi:MAG: hypothetical protein EON59_14020 [Alphaproteobacteria bacterium]|nr:MAG: hypothetical protein EON59_14020 [Alphaproteobacteria bacterium]